MIFGSRERRRRKRYRVPWEGILKARFADFDGRLSVQLSDISGMGCQVSSPRMEVDGRHLVVTLRRPELLLRLFSPEKVFDLNVEIRWYRWSVERELYRIGLEFIDLTPQQRKIVDGLIQTLRRQGAREVSSL